MVLILCSDPLNPQVSSNQSGKQDVITEFPDTPEGIVFLKWGCSVVMQSSLESYRIPQQYSVYALVLAVRFELTASWMFGLLITRNSVCNDMCWNLMGAGTTLP